MEMSNSEQPKRNMEYIELASTQPGISTWDPNIGEEGQQVLGEAPPESRGTIREEAVETLSKCVSPNKPNGTQTGIVVGHIQSGKTLSYTTVSALAHDNGFRLVIVFAGMTTDLLNQTTERLRSDLSQGPLDGKWSTYNTASLPGNVQMSIENELNEWREDPGHARTVLLTAMKNVHHLERVTDLLSNLDLDGVPALVIDDEADQASMNTMARNDSDEESSIYSAIVEIRSYLPHHTFLQYTATPQAPLLISLIDQLSPDFAQVLTPGDAYSGGAAFFEEYANLLTRQIPESETPSEVIDRLDPPQSLIDALKCFFLGATASFVRRDNETPPNRSMMIHPDRYTDTHRAYLEWVQNIVQRWVDTLRGAYAEQDREALIESFRDEYDKLVSVGKRIEEFNVDERIPGFDTLIDRMPRYLGRANIQEVNQHSDGVNWDRHAAHVLVGGAKLGRGFTVEGLTVSYMPRGLGVGNADTIQQRARWFGYKEDYLGFCRVFLLGDMIRAYQDYLQHERSVRSELKSHIESGQPLTEWKRRFLLDSTLRTTRRNVLRNTPVRGSYSGDWFQIQYPLDQDAVYNRKILDGVYQTIEFEQDEGHEERTSGQIHQVAHGLQLSEIYESLLVSLRYSNFGDSDRLLGILLQLREYMDNGGSAPLCSLFKMSGGQNRSRTLNSHGQVKQLFQGAFPDAEGEVYPGDRSKHTDDVTIQIHHLNLYKGTTRSDPEAQDIPVLAIWIPPEAGTDYVIGRN